MKKDSLGSLDLLQRLNSNPIPVNQNPVNNHPDNTEELSLSLSLNGKYGWDPQTNNKNKLTRACSIPEVVDVELSLNNNSIQLSRTCSLPDEVEWRKRKRKEMQMLRRSEVKRKRVDQKMKKHSPPLPGKFIKTTEQKLVRFSSSDGSIGSSGGSSGVSDLDSQPSSGTNRDTSGTNELSNTNKVQANLKIATNEPVKTNKVQGNPKITPNVHCVIDQTMPCVSTKEDGPDGKRIQGCVIDQTMPCVSTKEDGPDGKRIQGFLYRYGKGEEIRIVCVCHGNFLTPAEFVKHGGGGNVEHPLRHIIVTPLFS